MFSVTSYAMKHGSSLFVCDISTYNAFGGTPDASPDCIELVILPREAAHRGVRATEHHEIFVL